MEEDIMISPELIRLNPFFASLSHSHIATIADTSEEIQVMPGDYIFREGDILDHFFLVVEGEIDLIMGITDRNIGSSFSDRLFRNIEKIDVSIDTLGKGHLFGWSALVSPRHASSTGAIAVKPSRVVTFDCLALQTAFQRDNNFGYLMAQTVAQESYHKLQTYQAEMLSTFAMKADRLYVALRGIDYQRCISTSNAVHQVI